MVIATEATYRDLNSRRTTSNSFRSKNSHRKTNENRWPKTTKKRLPGSTAKLKRGVVPLKVHHRVSRGPSVNKNFVIIDLGRKKIRKKKRIKRLLAQKKIPRATDTPPSQQEMIYLHESPSFCDRDTVLGK